MVTRMSNKVYMGDNGFIYVEYIGDQNATTLEQTIQKVDKVINEVKSQNKPALVVCDISKVTKHDAGARKVGSEALNTLHYDKFAICGGNFFLRSIASILVKATGKSNVSVFKTQEEAVRWLKS